MCCFSDHGHVTHASQLQGLSSWEYYRKWVPAKGCDLQEVFLLESERVPVERGETRINAKNSDPYKIVQSRKFSDS